MYWSKNRWRVLVLYLVKPCKTSAAYEAIPDKDLCFDIDESADRLKQDVPDRRSGRVVVENTLKTDSEEKAKEAAGKIYELLR